MKRYQITIRLGSKSMRMIYMASGREEALSIAKKLGATVVVQHG